MIDISPRDVRVSDRLASMMIFIEIQKEKSFAVPNSTRRQASDDRRRAE